METLVGELGAVFVLAGLDFAKISRGDHASYVALWLKGLKEDKRVIFWAPAMRSGQRILSRACSPLPRSDGGMTAVR